MNELFTTPKTPEGKAYNLMQKLKIRDLEQIILEWAAFVGKLIIRYTIAKSKKEKEIIRKLFELSSNIIEEDINFFIKIYELREPLYEKYEMTSEDFKNYIEEIFYIKIAEIIKETIAKKIEEKLDFKTIIERFEKNLEKVAIYAGHCYGEDLYPTEDRRVQEVQRKAFEMTKSLIEKNIEVTIQVYELIHKLAPEKYKVEPKDFELEVKNYLKIGISVKFEEGTLDINKKFQMFQRFKNLKG